MARPKTKIIKLSDEEVKFIKRILRHKDSCKTVKDRCNILLDLDINHGKVLNNHQTAKSIGICPTTVTNTINKFLNEGLEATLTLNRNVNSDNAKRKVDGRAESLLVRLACGPVPEGHARWTLDLLEEKSKVILEVPVTRDTIRRTLKKTTCDLTGKNTGASRKKKMQNS